MPQREDGHNNVYRSLYGGDKNGLYTPGSGGNRRNPMIYGKTPSRWPYIALAVVVVLVLVLCVRQFACGGIFGSGEQAQQAQQQQQTSTDTDQGEPGDSEESERVFSGLNGTPQPGLDATVQVSAVGDCTLGNDDDSDVYTNFDRWYNDLHATNYYLANVRRFLNKDQLSICNLEGPLSTRGERAERDFAFRGLPEYAEILTDGGVEAANLANNHIDDYGDDAVADTIKALDKREITHFGGDDVATYESNGIKIGLYGIDAVTDDVDACEVQAEQDIYALQDDGCRLIIGYYHWGDNASTTVNEDQIQLAHAAVEAGCDLVLGSHPHLLQGIELYNNRYIVYSLSNFCYGGNDNPRDYDTMIFQQMFTFKDGQLVLDEASLKNVDIVPCSVSAKTTVNTYQPTPLKSADVPDMVEKLNGYSEELEGGVVFRKKLNEYGCAAIK